MECAIWKLDNLCIVYQIQFSVRWMSQVQGFVFPKLLTKKRCVSSIDLFSLYVLFSHFRPRDATRGNSFFQMSPYARANLRITNEKTKEKFP